MSFGHIYNPYAEAYGLYNKDEEWMKTQGMVKFLESLGNLPENIDDWTSEQQEQFRRAIAHEKYAEDAAPQSPELAGMIEALQGPPAVRALIRAQDAILLVFSRLLPEKDAKVKQVVKFLPFLWNWPKIPDDFEDWPSKEGMESFGKPLMEPYFEWCTKHDEPLGERIQSNLDYACNWLWWAEHCQKIAGWLRHRQKISVASLRRVYYRPGA